MIKPQEMFNKMYLVDDVMSNYPMCFDTAKKCTLIAIEEIINSSPSLPILSDNGTLGSDIEESKVYWLEVKSAMSDIKPL